MYAPHTVTIYNVTQEQDQNFNDTQKRYMWITLPDKMFEF